MQKNILQLTKTLIKISSTVEHQREIDKVLAVALKPVKDFTIERFRHNNVSSALVYTGKKRPERFAIILNAHLDVVPGQEKQYVPKIKQNRLFGRGAYDMKAAAAVEIIIFKELAARIRFPLGLQLVTDEEVGGFNGSKYQIEKGVKAKFVVAGEPTDFGINNKSKGVVWLKIKSIGKSAHGAYVWQGRNALWQLKELLDRLENEFPMPKKEVWKTSVNLARIETSNQSFNKVPADAAVWLDIRYIPEEKNTIINKIKKLIPSYLKTEFVFQEPIHFTPEDNKYIKLLKKSIKKITNKEASMITKHGASDVRHYNAIGCQGITFGPRGYGLHTDNEWVDIQSLFDYYQILKNFLLSV